MKRYGQKTMTKMVENDGELDSLDWIQLKTIISLNVYMTQTRVNGYTTTVNKILSVHL